MGPAGIGGPQGILDHDLVDELALGTFEDPLIGAATNRRDACQHHPACPAVRTARAFDRKKRRLRADLEIRHVCIPSKRAGAQHSQSPMEAEVSAVMERLYAECRKPYIRISNSRRLAQIAA